MRELDPGHIYELDMLESEDKFILTFPKRSGGAVQYSEEWPGPPNQEIYRALIKRNLYLNSIIPCVETMDAVHYDRMSLWCFEARAYRRKQEKLNRKKPEHDDSARVKAWRPSALSDDVPFGLINRIRSDDGSISVVNIEDLPIGDDRHITQEVIDRIVSCCS